MTTTSGATTLAPLGLDPEMAARLNECFREPCHRMPHQIAGWAGMSLTQATALVHSLYLQGLGELHLCVFHTCEEFPVDERRLEDGKPTLPWTCPECEELIENEGELGYGQAIVTTGPITFEGSK